MASVFISYSLHDSNVDRLRTRLASAGYGVLSVDFDPDVGIPAGRDWERELYAQLRRSDGVVVVATEKTHKITWRFVEVCLARSLGLPVFPLRMEKDAWLPLLADVQWADFVDTDSGFSQLLTSLRLAGLDPSDSFAWDPRRSPYPGLMAFSPKDAAVFFGRDREIDQLINLVQPTLRHGLGRFVAIVGPSGAESRHC